MHHNTQHVMLARTTRTMMAQARLASCSELNNGVGGGAEVELEVKELVFMK